ncbi:elongation factor G [Chloroflexi bacterium TSY]|nr:elongation factor G [Chloroflexi bacterium TSY]
MAKFNTEQIRNVVVLGHGGSGKTSLTEALLFKTGAISRVGRVEDGTTASDWDAEEQRRGISINLSVIPVEFQNTKINLIDTPGYLDFVGEVISALHVAEAGLLLVDAVAGAEVGTELAWDRLSALDKPRIIFVNKMDRENANFQNAVASLNVSFGSDANILPFQLPIGEADNFEGIINLVNLKAYLGPEGKEADIPADMADEVEAAHTALVEAAAEADDDLIMKYLEGEELSAEEVRHGLSQGVKSATITPVYCGTATGNIGLERLMTLVIRYTPTPNERPIDANKGDEAIELTNDASETAAGIVFKTTIDRYVGRMNYVRVCSGSIRKDDRLTVPRLRQEVRIANLFSIRGKETEPVDEFAAGDICVVTKLDNVLTNDSLSNSDAAISVEGASYPQPLYSVAVSPATKADSAKLGQGLTSLTEEDPTLTVSNISATKQTVLQGMGETHVDVGMRNLESKFGVKVEASVPKVPYQETISRPGSAQYRHKKQSGGAGQFAEVHMRVEPQDRGEGFEYASEVFGGAISSVFLPSIEKGIKQVMDQGVIAGFPVVDVKAVVYDGKEHPVDSKDIAFQTAGREAFKLAMQEAGPSLLEPIYSMEVIVPEEYMGDVMSDLNTRRGRVQGMEQKGNRSVIKAHVPFAEILRYGTDLRSMTQGRGVYTIEFDHYEPVPSHLKDQIVTDSQQEDGED